MAIINAEEEKIRALENAKKELQSMCTEIYKGEYVLVIGGDAILKEEFGEGNAEKYMKDAFAMMYPGNELTHENLRNFFKTKWKSEIEIEANEDLMSLLETKCFRLVFTTSFDDYVEQIMRQIWGEELQVYSIYDNNIKSLAYSEYNIIKPTLIYAFGRINSNGPFVLNDDNAINAIANRWLDSVNKPTKLINYIAGNSNLPNGDKDNSKKVLAIGCKLDDWEFRFFWYCLRQDVKKLKGDVAISLNEGYPEDDKLRNYLSEKGVNDKGKSREFLNTLQRLLNDREEFVYERLKNELKSGGVFISYASEDFPVACQIYNMLVESGAPVWLDKSELVGGDAYNDRISNAISECKVFIPLLSSTTMKDIQNDTWRYYKDVEWMQDNVKSYVPILVTTSGFDIKKMREKLPVKFQDRTAIGWSENGFKSRLIEAVKKGLAKVDELRTNKTE